MSKENKKSDDIWDEIDSEINNESKNEPDNKLNSKPNGEPKDKSNGEPNGKSNGEPNGKLSGEPNGKSNDEPSGKSNDESSDKSTDKSNDESNDESNGASKKKGLFKNKKKDSDKKTKAYDKADEEPEEEDINDYRVDEDGNFVKKHKKKRKKKKSRAPQEINIVKELLNLIIYFAIVILAVFFIFEFVGCKSLVNGPSMNPTLENKDHVWVDKLTYRFTDPKRFDVIIFNYDEDTPYVKRVIGLPGETVKIDQNGNIYINGKLMNESYGLERIDATKIGRASEPVLLGEDEFFVLGDNRNNSSDSRFADVGNIQKDDIVGKVIFRLSPFKNFGIIR